MAAFTAVLDPALADAYRPVQEQLEPTSDWRSERDAGTWKSTCKRRAAKSCDGKVSEKVIDARGIRHTHQRTNSGSLTTIFGEVEVEWQGYGGRGLEGLHPQDAELNLPPEEYSHTLQR